MHTLTESLVKPQGVFDKIVGKDVAYESGKIIGRWQRYLEVRCFLYTRLDNSKDAYERIVLDKLIKELKSRFE